MKLFKMFMTVQRNTYIKLFVRTYNSQYDILEELKQPKEIQYAKQRKIQKEVRKAIWLYKIKNFWNKQLNEKLLVIFIKQLVLGLTAFFLPKIRLE